MTTHKEKILGLMTKPRVLSTNQNHTGIRREIDWLDDRCPPGSYPAVEGDHEKNTLSLSYVPSPEIVITKNLGSPYSEHTFTTTTN